MVNNTSKRNLLARLLTFMLAIILMAPILGSIGPLEAKAEAGPTIKYAVSLYGIGIDQVAAEDVVNDNDTASGVTDVETEDAGLTFGPALGANFVTSYKSHTPSGTTTHGNEHRCIHNDDWATIIEWNNEDPEVYEQCIAEGCTHSVELDLPAGLKNASFDPKYTTGDGPGALCRELRLNDNSYENLRWHPNNNRPGDTGNYGTNYEGWGATRIRAMMNGADALTDTGDGTENGDTYSSSASSDINKSASVYTGDNNLLSAFPVELKSAIGARVTKYDSVYNQRTEQNLKTSYDKLWLLSPNEIWTTAQHTNSYYTHPLEGTQYPYFASKSNMGTSSTLSQEGTKAYYRSSNSTNTGSAYYWWLRSSHGNGANGALHVYNDGGCNGGSACYSYGVSPCFSLKRADLDHIKCSFEPNGGTITTKTALADVHEFLGIKRVSPVTAPAIPTRPGYIFEGWDVKSNKTSTATAGPADFAADATEIDLDSIDASEYENGLKDRGGTIKLYARWDYAPPYTIRYHQQNTKLDGYYQAEADRREYATAHDQPIDNDLKDSLKKNYPGFHLNKIESEDDAIQADGSTVINYYYDRDTFNVHFDGNGATSGTMEDQLFVGEIQQKLYDNRFTKENAVFSGWNTKADGSGTAYGDAAAVKNIAGNEETLTLYAQWIDYDSDATEPTNNKFRVTLKSGEKATIPNLPAGTKYTIKEVDNPEGWSQSGEVNTDGTITANDKKDATVSNAYTASGSVSLKAYKIMNIGEPEEGAFEFQLLQNGTVLQTKTNGAVDNVEEIQKTDGTEGTEKNPHYGMSAIQFEDITFTSTGTYTYTIKEKVGTAEDIRYDDHTETVTVNVTDNGDGTLKCTPVYDSDGPVFTNEKIPVLEPNDKGKLEISKSVSNAETDQVYPFRVTLTDASDVAFNNPVNYDLVRTDGKDSYKTGEIETVTAYSYTQNLNADGTKSTNYGNHWTNSNILGTGRESSNSQAHVIKIPGAESLHVKITYGGESATYDWACMWQGECPNYTAASNYGSSITGKLGGGKYTNASNTKEYDVPGDAVTFAFKSDGSGYGDGYGYYAVVTAEVDNTEYTNDYISTETLTSGGTINLASGQTAVFDKLPAGVKYKVEEVEGAGYELIESNNTEGTIEKDVTSEATFKNILIADDSATIRMHKTYFGGEIEEGQFAFDLLDSEGYVIQTKTAAPDGNVIFDPIDYSFEDAGKQFKYYVREVTGNDDTIVYDEHQEEVLVDVVGNGDGTISANVTYSGNQEFTNKHLSAITVRKNVSGSMGNRHKDFRFRITFGDGYDQGGITATKTDAEGAETTGSVTSATYDFTLAHDETIRFNNVPAGTTYNIVELDANRSAYSTTATATTAEITTDAIDRQVHAARTLGADESVTFTNNRDTAVPTDGYSVMRFLLPVLLIAGCAAGYIRIARKKKIR